MSGYIYHNNHHLLSYHDNGSLQYDYHTIDIIAPHYLYKLLDHFGNYS